MFYLLALFILTFNSDPIGLDSEIETIIPYNLTKPDKKYELPAILNEVSGLTDIDSAHVACVQDEIGTVFIYNFLSGAIVYQHKFEASGDFEGLTFTGKSLFILRSDGRLTEWSKFRAERGGESISHSMLPLPTTDNEGLCYDNKYNRLLIATKSKPVNREYKSERFIYEYDLTSKKLNPLPLYSINTRDLEIAAKKFNIVQQDKTVKGKLKPFNFRPSSLAVQPYTSDIYIISAEDNLLVVINRKGDIIYMEELLTGLFAKAEGITFLNNGTMIITNEAAGSAPNLLLFKPEKIKK